MRANTPMGGIFRKHVEEAQSQTKNDSFNAFRYKKMIAKAKCCAAENLDALESSEIDQLNDERHSPNGFVDKKDNGKVIACLQQLFAELQPTLRIVHVILGGHTSILTTERVIVRGSEVRVTCDVFHPAHAADNNGRSPKHRR